MWLCRTPSLGDAGLAADSAVLRAAVVARTIWRLNAILDDGPLLSISNPRNVKDTEGCVTEETGFVFGEDNRPDSIGGVLSFDCGFFITLEVEGGWSVRRPGLMWACARGRNAVLETFNASDSGV